MPKYYCTTVQWDGTSPVINVNRFYEGQINCGVGCTIVGWELYWMQDWQCSPYPTCTFLRNYGEQPWQTNGGFVWWDINANGTMNQDALVNMVLRYHERDPMFGTDRYFCSPQQDHRIWNYTSIEIGSGGC